MAKVTQAEKAEFDRCRRVAVSLRNGDSGNIGAISNALADLIDLVVSMAATEHPTGTECDWRHEAVQKEIDLLRQVSRGGQWKTALAIVLPIVTALCAIMLPVVLHCLAK